MPNAPAVETLTAAITGTTEAGEALTAQTNALEGSNFEWLRDGTAISAAANAPIYQLSTDDVCTHISVRVTPPSDSSAAPVTSEQTDLPSFPTSAVQQPTVSGCDVVGKMLTAQSSDWPAGTKLSYQWLRNGSPITAATSSSDMLQAADHGKQITVRVTGEISDCFTHQVTSTALEGGKVLGAALVAATPTIKSTAKVGNTLTVQRETWAKSTKFSYQWLRNGKAID